MTNTRETCQAIPYRSTPLFLVHKACSSNKAISIRGSAVVKLHAVYHSIAIKPVVRALGWKLRIGAVAYIKSIEIFWQFTDDCQVVYRYLFCNRGKVVPQIRTNDANFPRVGRTSALAMCLKACDQCLEADVYCLRRAGYRRGR